MEKLKQNPIVKKLGLNRILLVCVLILMFLVFKVVLGNKFPAVDSIKSTLNYVYFLGFLSLGVTFVIATGGIDFSIGPVMFCTGIRLLHDILQGSVCSCHDPLHSDRSLLWYFQWLDGFLHVSATIHYFHGIHEHCKRYCFCIHENTVRKLAGSQ